jgi:hypothetical protein
MIIPNGHDEDDTLGESLVDGAHTTNGREVVIVAKCGLLGGAEFIGDGIVGSHAGNVDLGVLDDLAVLNVDTADFLERTSVSVVGGLELGDDGDLLGGIDNETLSVEGGVTHAV